MNDENLKEKDIQNEDSEVKDSGHANDDMLQDAVTKLSNEIEEQKGKYLALMAEFQNYKKRVETEKAMFGALANMGLIEENLEVFDDINMALNDENLEFEGSKAALKSAQDKIVSAIERAGVERVNVNVGDEFNKDTMEAISTIPSEDQKGKVIAIINSAFKFKDREGIIKAAKVIVGK